MFEDLKIYCAPLQGFTDYIWRNTHVEMFGGIDIYYTPFMRIVNGEIPKRDILDILPENNTAPIRPQIIACAPTDSVMMATKMKEMGYENSIETRKGQKIIQTCFQRKSSKR